MHGAEGEGVGVAARRVGGSVGCQAWYALGQTAPLARTHARGVMAPLRHGAPARTSVTATAGQPRRFKVPVRLGTSHHQSNTHGRTAGRTMFRVRTKAGSAPLPPRTFQCGDSAMAVSGTSLQKRYRSRLSNRWMMA